MAYVRLVSPVASIGNNCRNLDAPHVRSLAISMKAWPVSADHHDVAEPRPDPLTVPTRRRPWWPRRNDESTLLARAMDAMSPSVILIDARAPGSPIIWANSAFERLTGYTQAELLGRSWRFSEGAETDPEIAARLHDAVQHGQEFRVVIRHHRSDGSAYWSETFMAPVYDDHGVLTHYMSVQKDVTERAEATTRTTHMAYHDDLTGLPNRAQLQEHLALALARADRKQTTVALLFLDLDGFKAVNDRFGHFVGDHLLVDVARRWRNVTRDGEALARLGGDEFVLLLTDLRPATARESALAAAERCESALALPFDIEGVPGETVKVRVSAGVALYPEDGTTPAELMLAADAAMYASKRRVNPSDS